MRFSILALTLGLSACTSYEVTDQQLSGTIAGESWIFASGETNAFLSDESTYFVSLYGEQHEPCGFGQPSGPGAIVSVPVEGGTHDFSFNFNMTLHDGEGDNLIIIDGVLEVYSIVGDTIEAGLVADGDGDNNIDGTFTAKICPD